jgi:Ca-activated chloride channel family protein
MVEFAVDNLALLILTFFLISLWFFYKWASHYNKPALYFPDLKILSNAPKTSSFKKRFSQVPFYLLLAAFLNLSLAFLDPHSYHLKNKLSTPSETPPPLDGIAIYLITDESGSMMEEITAKMPNGKYEKMAKIDFLKKVTTPFVMGRPSDLMGLIAFSRTADVRTPLTLDHKAVIEEIELLNPSIKEEDAGTAMGFAVFKTVNLIIATKHFANDLIKKGKPAYEIKNAIIVLVTDGVQNVNAEDASDPFRSMDIAEAANYAKENNVRLYIINVDPEIATPKFKPERNLMKLVTENTGGNFYLVDNITSLSDIFSEINKIEKDEIQDLNVSKDKLPTIYQRVSYYPFLLALSMGFLILYILLETLIFKRIP